MTWDFGRERPEKVASGPQPDCSAAALILIFHAMKRQTRSGFLCHSEAQGGIPTGTRRRGESLDARAGMRLGTHLHSVWETIEIPQFVRNDTRTKSHTHHPRPPRLHSTATKSSARNR